MLGCISDLVGVNGNIIHTVIRRGKETYLKDFEEAGYQIPLHVPNVELLKLCRIIILGSLGGLKQHRLDER